MKKCTALFFVGLFAAQASQARALFHETNALPLTTFNVTVRVGSADDPADKAGLAHLTGELIRNGGVEAWKRAGHNMPAHTRQDFEQLLYPLAAQIDVSEAKEQTSFRVTTSSESAQKVFSLLVQMLAAPAFDAKEFDRIKTETQDYLTHQLPRDDEEELGKAALDLAIYGKGHPYAHPVAGTVSGVKNITRDDVLNFYKNFYTQKRVVIGIAGHISAEVKKLAAELEAALPPGTTTQARIAEPAKPAGLQVTIVEGPFDGTGVHFGEALPINRHDDHFPALVLMSNAFGKHRSFVGRLMHDVRELRGLNYGDYSYVEDFPYGGELLTEPLQVARQVQAFTIWGRPTPHENGCFLVRQLYRELKNLKANGITADEYNRTKSHLIGALPILSSSLERQLGYGVDSVFYRTSPNYIGELVGKLGRTSQDAVKKAIDHYIDADNIQLVVVTDHADKMKKELLDSECDIHYASGIDKSAEIKAEDKEISHFALPLKEENIKTIRSESLFE